MQTQEIERRFRHHPPRTEADVVAHEDIREQFRALAHHVNDNLPEGREKAQTLSDLEDGLMHANAALARARAVPADTGQPEPHRTP